MTANQPEFKRITREEAFNRDPFDTTPVEYEDEVHVSFTNLETGQMERKIVKSVARLNGKPSPAIVAYYEKLRKQGQRESA